MSEIYPVDDLVWNNNNEGALYREQILTLRDGDPAQWMALFEQLDSGGYHDMQRVAEFIGIAPDHGSVWATLRLGELKTMLCLAAGELHTASQWVDWCLHMDQLTVCRLHLYHCIKALLDIELDDNRQYSEFEQGLAKLYGQEYLTISRKIVDGEEIFHGLHSPGLSLQGFETHAQLLNTYNRLQQAKQYYWRNQQASPQHVAVKDSA